MKRDVGSGNRLRLKINSIRPLTADVLPQVRGGVLNEDLRSLHKDGSICTVFSAVLAKCM